MYIGLFLYTCVYCKCSLLPINIYIYISIRSYVINEVENRMIVLPENCLICLHILLFWYIYFKLLFYYQDSRFFFGWGG